jgi:hypothetical protein
MRINVYSQELTSEIQSLAKPSDTGITYPAVRLFLHSSERLHSTATDDDRSAITFWLPKSDQRRENLALTFEAMAKAVRNATEGGADG